MNYNVYAPCHLLAPYVKCYWSLEHDNNSASSSIDRIFPDGCIELLFHYGCQYKKYLPDNSHVIQPRSFIHGQIRQYIEIEAMGRAGIFSVRFSPNGLQPFLNDDVQALTEQTVNMYDLWKNEGDVLEDKILNAKSNNERVQITETFLLGKLRSIKKNNDLISYCVNSIRKAEGNINIDALANSLYIGRRQLERKFIAGVGLSPKLLSRIVRFQYTIKHIETQPANTFTEIAHRSGFYDQAHFIKDFKEFTGLNPKQYYSENLEMTRFFNADQ